MQRFVPYLWLALGITAGCGDTNGGAGTGGSGGAPSAEQSSYRLSCTIDTLVLEIPIELTYQPDRPFVAGATTDLTFSATVIFDEAFSAALIDAGVSKVDIMEMDITSWVLGATPSMLAASLAEGINDLDLEVDTDDNGVPGPHRLSLDDATVTSTVVDGAVELGLSLERINLQMGDFHVPDDCLSPTLVGFSARFAVEPPG